ncbi:MAG: acyl carrier protein, partial [Intestinibacter sp.]
PYLSHIRYGITKEEAIEKDDFEQLGLDSLSLYSLVDDAEQKFNVEIDTDDITEINSITKIFNYINNKRNE